MKFKLAAVIEPNQARWKAIREGLKKSGLKVSEARSIDELTREQLVVLGNSVGSASRAARAVRSKLGAVFVLAAQAKGFKSSAADAVLPLPVSPNDLRVRLTEFGEHRAPTATRTGTESIVDPSTNFYTFSHFKEVLYVEVKRARRYGFPLAVALIDFDGDPLENAVQSQLLGGLALAIRRSLRDTDYPVQYSAERVLILMPHTDLAGSLIVARRIVERVARATLQVGDVVLHPTISVGVGAGDPSHEYGFSDLVRQAQDGLAVAVEQGGNRVEFTSRAPSPSPSRPDAPSGPPNMV
jgi:diguanylate cyclase (GGDEF)-like protein